MKRTVRIASGQVDTPPRIALWALAIHTFTEGVIGTAIIAMITRTARAHTGRELVAGKVEVACYGLFILATLVRVLGPWLAPQFTMAWIYPSGLCWAAALVLYCVRYGAWLVLPVSMASRVEELVLLEAASKRDPS
ncbi:NnrS family protein [Paraburkholderia youngii]|uniref:NnrS family protein n=1 Tax=Paraburkholderia youngii TaxID=2782701 RepID=UPI0020D1815E|nr:NnrS family protein [Paraburkholderia youngii]